MDKKNKRIFFISNSTVPLNDNAGGSVVIYRHLKRLKDDGYHVIVVYLNTISQSKKDNIEFEFHCVEKKSWHPPIRKKTPFLTRLRISFTFTDLDKKFQFDQKNDLILGIMGEASNLLFIKLKKRSHIPYFLFFHDDHVFNRYGSENLLTSRNVVDILSNSDFIFSVSDQLTNLIREKKYNQVETLFPIPNGIIGDIKEFGPKNSGELNLAVSGNFGANHFEMLKRIGKAAKEAGSRFFCLSKLPESCYDQLHWDDSVIARPMFPTLLELFDFILNEIDALVVFYSFDPINEPRLLTSFPSKFIEYCHLGLPIIIVAPLESSIGNWAQQNNWQSYVQVNDQAMITLLIEKLKDRSFWNKCKEQSLLFANNKFNPDIIHNQFIQHLGFHPDQSSVN